MLNCPTQTSAATTAVFNKQVKESVKLHLCLFGIYKTTYNKSNNSCFQGQICILMNMAARLDIGKMKPIDLTEQKFISVGWSPIQMGKVPHHK